MSVDTVEIAERYRKVAARFSRTVDAVPSGAWDRPAPCDGWVARDVVDHLASWLPGFFFDQWSIDAGPAPSAIGDPVAAWHWLDDALQAALDDPAVAGAERDTHMGRSSLAQQVDMIATPDVLVHTWDLARATGLDEELDVDEVHCFVEGMEPMDAMLRTSGQYGPRVPVPDDASEQTRLIAFLGRQP
ncbi:maleylpyruvate isomerase family mycothiol-dependent enzyme [soil metagenome]